MMTDSGQALPGSDPDRFQRLLDEQTDWPAPFTFKFIVPRNQLAELKQALDGYDIEARPSRRGNYISVTLRPVMGSSDEILSVYERVSRIPGIVSL